MHDAYEDTSILNITVQIESMAAYGEYIANTLVLIALSRR